MQCCGLNGGLFWLSMFLFEYGLLPTLSMLLTLLFGSESGTGQLVWSWLQPALSCIFGAIWVVPLFLLSKFINNLWFQVCIVSFPYVLIYRPSFIASGLTCCALFAGYCQFSISIQPRETSDA